MEFEKERVFTSLNADELRAGDKVIVGDTITFLKYNINNNKIYELIEVKNEDYSNRFIVDIGLGVGYALAYLVERKENCTNCELRHKPECNKSKWPEQEVKVFRCSDYKSETEQKAVHDCKSCRYKNCGFKDFNTKNDCNRWEAEPKAESHYRPFRDTDELVKVWDAKYKEKYGLGRIDKGLDMPHIWVRYKMNQCGQIGILITKYEKNYVQIDGDMIAVHALMADYEFLDGSPCGVEE